MPILGGGNKYMLSLFGLAVACSVAYFFWMPVAEGSPFHTSFHFVCHFSIMMMGALVYVCRDRISIGASGTAGQPSPDGISAEGI